MRKNFILILFVVLITSLLIKGFSGEKTQIPQNSENKIILLTDKKGTLPETILSRCQSLFFQRPSKDILKKICPDIAKSEFFDIAYLGNCGSLIFLDELRK